MTGHVRRYCADRSLALFQCGLGVSIQISARHRSVGTFHGAFVGGHLGPSEPTAEVATLHRFNQRRLATARVAKHFELDSSQRLTSTGELSYEFLLLLLIAQPGQQIGNIVVTLSDGTDLRYDHVLARLVDNAAGQAQGSNNLDVTILGGNVQRVEALLVGHVHLALLGGAQPMADGDQIVTGHVVDGPLSTIVGQLKVGTTFEQKQCNGIVLTFEGQVQGRVRVL